MVRVANIIDESPRISSTYIGIGSIPSVFSGACFAHTLNSQIQRHYEPPLLTMAPLNLLKGAPNRKSFKESPQPTGSEYSEPSYQPGAH